MNLEIIPGTGAAPYVLHGQRVEGDGVVAGRVAGDLEVLHHHV